MAVNNLVNIKIKAVENLSTKLGVIKGAASNATAGIAKLGGALLKVGAAAATATAGVATFGVKSAMQVEQTRVAFDNLYGSSEKAGEMMQKISDFAKATPFEFNELTDAALKLKNVAGIGDEELIPMLTNLGDIAASQSKPMEQAVEAFNDAIAGEFERLKEFGIKASKNGEMVAFSFKGQTVEVENTKEAIGGYLQSLGQMEGIAGAMDAQSQTFAGRLSTVKDQLKGVAMAVVGVSETGEIIKGGFFDKISVALNSFGTWLQENQETIKLYIQAVMESFNKVFTFITRVANEFFTGGTGDWTKFIEDVKAVVNKGLEVIKNFWQKYGDDITLVVKTLFNMIRNVVKNVMEYIGPLIKSTLNLIGGIFKTIASVIRGDWSGAWDGIKTIASNALGFVKNLIATMLNAILGIFGTSISGILSKVSNFVGVVSVKFGEMKDNVIGFGQNMRDGFVNLVENMKNAIIAKITAALDFVMEKVEAAKAMINGIKESANNAINGAKSKISNAKASISNSFSSLGNKITSGFRATGGPVMAGSTYRVNEQSQEYFTPSQSGYISKEPQSAGSGEIKINFGNVYLNNNQDERAFFNKVKKAVIETQRQARNGF